AGKSGKCGRHHTGLLVETVNAITFIFALLPAAHFPVSNEKVGPPLSRDGEFSFSGKPASAVLPVCKTVTQ
ncbi:hypothetical protein MJM45_32190, partial [Salmonella enterica subsp. enterica serovar Kentucky]|nr:hypothetical protein [Salmonella enterica subsp. enterica serovar Kentucky]